MTKNSEGNRFKVGDRVRIARVDDYYKSFPHYEEYVKMIGTEATITGIDPDNEYVLDTPIHQAWRDSELEPAKEAQVLEILRTWRSSR